MTQLGERTRARRAYDPAAVRARILDAAANQFQTAGFNSTTMHDVARGAGVSGGALYHHFATKKALGLAVIRERVAREIAETWLAPMSSAETSSEGIARVLNGVIAGLEHRQAVTGCPLNNLSAELSLADPDFRDAITLVFDDWRASISDSIHADIARGLLRGVDAAQFATLVVATFSGAMGMAKAKQSTEPLRVCAQQIHRMLAVG